ncbi:MAG: hypothetical protein H6737_00120 [Alphaproteobacteria bacterium]|nr:hypothetical protein [Alphaproteobacteria bacterium]
MSDGSDRPVVALLLPPSGRPPPPPEQLPIGRAMLALADRLQIVVGGQVEHRHLVGHVAVPGGWREARLRPSSAIDRFPSFTQPLAYARLLHGLGAVPVLNPPALTALLRDKVRTQDALHGLGMPDLETDPRRYPEALARWGAGFLKPRFGSFGRGVQHVTAGASPPARAVVDGVDQPMILQRAVPPPPGYGGVALRILVQRGADGWRAYPPVARHHPRDAVVNHARGAAVSAAEDRFGPDVAASAQALALAVAARFPEAIELGVDAVLDPELEPHVIEVNARPRGRLHALAEADPDRFGALHAQACEQPFLER